MSQLFRVEQSEKTSDDYLTPRWVFDTLGLDFDLDVAAPPWDTHVPATRKYTKADDGLTAPWEGRVWMNPPYSNAAPWVRRFIEHGHGISLLPFGRSNWVNELWNAAGGVCVAPRNGSWTFDQGMHIRFTVWFAAFGDECVEGHRAAGEGAMTEPWPNYNAASHITRALLGPQPKRECCPSCQIIARAVARLAYAIGYEETGDELADLLAAMGGER